MILLDYLQNLSTTKPGLAGRLAKEILNTHEYIHSRCQNDQDFQELNKAFTAALQAEINL